MSESQTITEERLPNIHPGEILKEEFLDPMNISLSDLSQQINVSETILGNIVKGKKSVNADIAIRFSRFFGTTPEFWLNLQNQYDIEEEEHIHAEDFNVIQRYYYEYIS